MTSNGKPRLELTWPGKEQRPRLEPRILLEDPARSYHAAHRVTDHDLFDNRLIFGDNLLALKALESEFAGKVKCVFIDPPYNTGSAFEHYDDGLEHSIWLSMMRDRLEIIRRLMREDGSLWITIDDNEAHYLKVLCDEVFGRQNFIATNVWQKRFSRSNDAAISVSHDYVLAFARDQSQVQINRLKATEIQAARYTNPDNDPRGPWTSVSFNAPNIRPNLTYRVVGPTGTEFWPPAGRHWSTTETEYQRLLNEGRIWFGADGSGVPRLKKYWSESAQEITPWTWWPHEEVGHTQDSMREVQAVIPNAVAFGTPKPERLIQRVLEIATNPGDLVLDSFAGSGTTGAVAHKMGRRWIMVELGEHCHTHIIPRLRKVIDGEDPGGITKAVAWQGGGGFRYFRLAPSLLEKDAWGRLVINPAFNAEMLAEAVCKLEGFTFAPSESHYWQHGHSTERDFIYVTTATLNHAQLQQLSDEVGPERTLLVACGAFRGSAAGYPNLTIKKIPGAVLDRCEWGRDDYSLSTQNLSEAPPAEGQQALALEGV